MKSPLFISIAVFMLFLVGCKEEKAIAADNYPLTKCVVSGKELGTMGAPFKFTHEDGTLVKFCCEPCVDEFKESPEEYLAEIAEAERARQKDSS